MQRPVVVQAPASSLRHHYGRRNREYEPEDCAPEDGRSRGGDGVGEKQLAAALCRMKAHSPHFRNVGFRLAFTELAMRSGTLAASLRGRAAPLRLQRAAQPRGAACAAERRCSVEVCGGFSVLDAALALQEGAHLMKPGLILAAHPTDSRASHCCYEEQELLARTSWSTAFLDSATCTALRGGGAAAAALGGEELGEAAAAPCLEAGSPSCLFAEDLAVVRDEGGQGQLDGGQLLDVHKELPAAVCFLPRPMDGSYATTADRVEYRQQVAAVLRVCCLLHLDGVVVGCSEGVAGSEVFGHPLREAAEVWRDVLRDRGASGAEAPFASHFKKVVFVCAKDNPLSSVRTPSVLQEVLAGDLQ